MTRGVTLATVQVSNPETETNKQHHEKIKKGGH